MRGVLRSHSNAVGFRLRGGVSNNNRYGWVGVRGLATETTSDEQQQRQMPVEDPESEEVRKLAARMAQEKEAAAERKKQAVQVKKLDAKMREFKQIGFYETLRREKTISTPLSPRRLPEFEAREERAAALEPKLAAINERTAEWSKKDKSLLLDLEGMNVRVRVSGTSRGDTYYDTGLGNVFRTPKPLHKQPGKKGGPSVDLLREAGDRAGLEPEEIPTTDISGTITMKMMKSPLMTYKGDLLPDFDRLVSETGGLDPLELSWRIIEDAANRKRPVRGRILNPLRGGFTCAIGAQIGFLPNSHLSPFLRGPTSNQWENRTKGLEGKALWVMVLSHDTASKNVVVSHKNCAPHYWLPQLVDMPYGGNRRARMPRRHQAAIVNNNDDNDDKGEGDNDDDGDDDDNNGEDNYEDDDDAGKRGNTDRRRF